MNAEMIDLQIFAGDAGAGASGAGAVSAGAGARSAGTGGGSGAGAGGGGTGGPSGSGKGQSGQSGSAGQALNVAEAGADEMFPGEAAPGRSREKGLLSPERQKRCGRRQGTDTPDGGCPLPGFRAGVPERGRNCQTGRIRCPAGEQQTRGEAVGGADEKSWQGNVPVADAERCRNVGGSGGRERGRGRHRRRAGAGKKAFYPRKGRGEYTEGPGAVGKLPGQGAGCC